MGYKIMSGLGNSAPKALGKNLRAWQAFPVDTLLTGA